MVSLGLRTFVKRGGRASMLLMMVKLTTLTLSLSLTKALGFLPMVFLSRAKRFGDSREEASDEVTERRSCVIVAPTYLVPAP